jgi:hypothetical protein
VATVKPATTLGALLRGASLLVTIRPAPRPAISSRLGTKLTLRAAVSKHKVAPAHKRTTDARRAKASKL